MTEEASYADQFIASTYSYAKNMGLSAKHAKRIEPYLAAYRDDMRKAHRFVLDADFTRYATEVASTTSPEKLLARLQYAILPYDITWIEFPLEIKVRTMRTLHGLNPELPDVGKGLGLLLHRMSDTDATCQIICEMSEIPGALTPTLIAYYFSQSEEIGYKSAYASGGGCLAMTNSKFAQDIGKGSLWGYSNPDGIVKSKVLESLSDLQYLALPLFLSRHGELVYSRLYRGLNAALNTHMHKNRMQAITEVLMHETTEFTGMMRWVVTVLAMLNEVPVYADYIKPAGQVRMGLTRKRPAMDYHRLTLRLPKVRPRAYIERHLSNIQRRHKAHEVMSHWRTYLEHEKINCPPDNHDWQYNYAEGWRACTKCTAYSRRIPEHIRGNPELGWVRKDYVIKKEPDHEPEPER